MDDRQAVFEIADSLIHAHLFWLMLPNARVLKVTVTGQSSVNYARAAMRYRHNPPYDPDYLEDS